MLQAFNFPKKIYEDLFLKYFIKFNSILNHYKGFKMFTAI